MKTQQTDKSLNSLTAAIMREGVRDGWIEDERTSPPQAPKQGDTCPATAGPTSTGEPRKSASAHAASHSPLPWFTMASSNPDELHPMVSIWSGRETKESIVCNSCSPSDAAFIVRACNEYEQVKSQLLEFASLAVKAERQCNEVKAHAQRLADALKGLLYSRFEQQAFETAREALAQWEGGKQ